MHMRWLTASEICNELKISITTLHNWKKQNKLSIRRLSPTKFLYDIDHILGNNQSTAKKNVIYARVSNTKQKEDLQRQISFIREFMVKNGIVPDQEFSDIGSGMNENRHEFNNLIKEVINGNIDTIFISYKDRLTRFGFGYFEFLFEQFGTTIKVINLTKEEDFQNELVEDLTSIIHHFSMKLYSNRRKELKQTMKNIEKEMQVI